MTIAVGGKLPDAPVYIIGPNGPMATTTIDLFSGKKAILFSVPGAFTPTCSARHLPGFMEKAGDFCSKGVNIVACVSINDAFVMEAWANKVDVGDAVLMVADGNGDFANALGLDVDQSTQGMGNRAQRAAMILDDCVVTNLFIEPQGSFGVSSAENVLAAMQR